MPFIAARAQAPAATPAKPRTERHLRNIRQLTFGGENAEAYFSPDGTRLIFQSTRDGYPCDQIYTMKIDGTDLQRVSTGHGPDDVRLFLSGRQGHPVRVDARGGAGVPAETELRARLRLADLRRLRHLSRQRRRLEPAAADDARPATTPRRPSRPTALIAFTSVRDGDMEIYSMKADGSDVRRLTNSPGPDGGPFFSWDGKRIAFRGRPLAARPGARPTTARC